MRPALLVVCSIAALAACSDQDSRVVFAQVNWMEWPAEVLAAQSFTVRLIGYGASCEQVLRFDPGTAVDNSAVTFEPFFLVSGQPTVCPLDARADVTSPIAPFFDTRASIAGLTPPNPRSYEVRAAADVSVPALAAAALPVRTFGEIVVRSDSANASHTNVGGSVYAVRDSTGCVDMYVGWPQTEYVIENPPADTATYWYGFVQGYLYRPSIPVCGDSVVFHLLTRN